MKKITFVIPSRNNLEFLKLAYNSIKNLGNSHEVLVLDDASVDGTTEWLSFEYLVLHIQYMEFLEQK